MMGDVDRPPTSRDRDAARVLLGGLPGADDDRRMFHRTGGRIAGADACIHSFFQYGSHGVYRHHVFSPDTSVPLDVIGETVCVCGFAERSIDGQELHQPCWLAKGN